MGIFRLISLTDQIQNLQHLTHFTPLPEIEKITSQPYSIYVLFPGASTNQEITKSVFQTILLQLRMAAQLSLIGSYYELTGKQRTTKIKQ